MALGHVHDACRRARFDARQSGRSATCNTANRMRSIRTSQKRPSCGAAWRGVVALLLIALAASTPVAGALCNIEHLAGRIESGGNLSPGAVVVTEGPFAPDSPGDRGCCGEAATLLV